MAYDPTKPANNTPLDAGEMRNQLAGLKTLIDGKAASADLGPAIEANSAGTVMSMGYLNLVVSDPPTKDDVQVLADKLDALLQLLRRE